MKSRIPEDRELIASMAMDQRLRRAASDFMRVAGDYRYSYNFQWLGRPVIQLPQDLLAMQEIIWRIRPTLVIETGVAHGGSLVFHASILQLIGEGRVIGIELELREHNRLAISEHPLSGRIEIIEGSSIDPDTVRKVYDRRKPDDVVLVVLDSNHTHDHVLAELRAYGDLVSPESYLIAFDTIIEQMPHDAYPDRPWGPGNSPHTAIHQFLEEDDRFQIDDQYDQKLLISHAFNGYLRKIR